MFRKLTFCSTVCISQYRQQITNTAPLRNVPDDDILSEI
jgi:hypothetical protein